MTITPNNPPKPALKVIDRQSFAYKTAMYRWPVIITKTIDDIYKTRYELDPIKDQEKSNEAKEIMNLLGVMKYEMQRKRVLTPIEDDGESDLKSWNDFLSTYFHGENWYSAAWLFVECYLYRRMHSAFAKSKYWKNYDPFFRQKEDTFKASFKSVIRLAERFEELINKRVINVNTKDEDNQILFHELVQLSLWGNATDLSLLTNLTHDDISDLQSPDSKKLEKNILANDLEKVWNKISNYQNVRIDFVLDNSGFELYGDLMLADWLVQSGHASKIHFHVKKIPWFVSDTTELDFKWLLNALKDDHFFSSHSINVEENNHNYLQSLTELSNRWEGYLKKQVWIIESDFFWTSPYSYWHIKEIAPDLFNDLKSSSLIIFKGDLNYRKLIYDCKWSTTTSFKEAIGPLADEIGVPPILALRTSKAEVIVGLPDGLEEYLNNTDKDWMYSGKYAVIQFNEGTK